MDCRFRCRGVVALGYNDISALLRDPLSYRMAVKLDNTSIRTLEHKS
jgi:hypothetical protein